MQYVIWCVICGIIAAGSLCAALGAENRAQDAEMRCDAAEFFYRVEHDITEKANDVSKRAREERDNAIQALKNETAERARVERAYSGVVDKNEALERRVNELEAELLKANEEIETQEKVLEDVWDRLHRSEEAVRYYVHMTADMEATLAKKQKVLDYIAEAEKEDAV